MNFITLGFSKYPSINFLTSLEDGRGAFAVIILPSVSIIINLGIRLTLNAFIKSEFLLDSGILGVIISFLRGAGKVFLGQRVECRGQPAP